MRIIDQLVYKISGDTTQFNTAINSSDKKMSSFGSTAMKIFTGLGIGVSIGAITNEIKKSITAFSGYEESLAKVSTLFGDVNVDMDNLSSKVIGVSSDTGLLADEINEGLYSALSAGVEVTEDMSGALDLVEKSAKLARAGFTNTDTALSATVKTQNAYKLGLDSTDRIQKILIQTQNKGITTVGELGQNLAKVTPTAAAFGVSFENVGAALATMTTQGINTEMATTYLSQIITELGKSGTKASEGLKEAAESAGLTETTMTGMLASGMSLGDVLDLLDTSAKKGGNSLVDMFSSVEAGKGALALTGSNLTTFNSDLKSMSTEADLVDEGFQKMVKTLKGQSDILNTNFHNLRIELSEKMLPAITSITGFLVTMTSSMLGQNTAGGKLKSSYGDLETALENYNKVLDTSKGKTDAITQTTLSQARAQMQLALQTASETYQKSNDDLEKYTNTIQKSEKWIAKYDKTLADLADGTGYTADQLNVMTEQERLTILSLTKGVSEGDRYNTIILARKGYQESLITATSDLAKAQSDEESFVNLLTQGYLENNASTKLLLDLYPQLKEKVISNVEAYQKEKKALDEKNESIRLAKEAFKGYANASDEALKRIISEAEKHKDSVYWAEMSRLATEKLNSSISQNSEIIDKQTEILDNNAKGMETIDTYALALGSSYDANSEKASLLNSTIKALIDAGLSPESDVVKKLTEQLSALGKQTEATISGTDDFSDSTKTLSDALKSMSDSYLSDNDKALAGIQAQADAYLEAGVSIVDVAKWQEDQLAKLQEEQTSKATEEADKSRKAWESYATSIASSISSTWSSILEMSSNATDTAIENVEDEYQAKIDALDEELLGEEEYAKQVSALEEERDAQKTALAQKQAEREKALAIYEATINTAKAIMQIWSDSTAGGVWGKAIWTALAASAGIAQVAAIASEPLPSYDVGTIDVPTDRVAQLHEGETVLTKGITEEAKTQGITIQPVGTTNSNSVSLVIYLDGKEIARNTIDNLNSGSVGTIKARVVK